ncbi:MAG: hypothetical protein HMLKMBBP_00573 [Planctomycetes bacterium]|nr:hypothetical protein [Planctomycetota bacterium]
MGDPARVTRLLSEAREGSAEAREELVRALHSELSRIARAHMRRQSPSHTLQPTALVNEAYLRLFPAAGGAWNDRAHFLAAASLAMRSVLADMARARGAEKRGPGRRRVSLHDGLQAPDSDPGHDVLAVHEALDRLARLDPVWARVVELRFFGGLSSAEAAAVLGVSTQQERRLWNRARAWLQRELSA